MVSRHGRGRGWTLRRLGIFLWVGGCLLAVVLFLVDVLGQQRASTSSPPPPAMPPPPPSTPVDRPAEAICDEPLPESLLLVHELLRSCDATGSVDWDEYKLDPGRHAGKNVHVFDRHVKSGTLRITSAVCVRVMEDLLVHFEVQPNFWPDPEHQPEYASAAYRLGFFAGFSVETSGPWVIDLGGHTVAQSAAFLLQQRFFAHIELTDRPFLPHEGPANFGDAEPPVVSARLGAIVNGHLGASSHHAIHGNGVSHLLLENLTIADVEVAGVSLNDARFVVLRSVAVLGTPPRVPVRATYSQARFAVFHAMRALGTHGSEGDPEARRRLMQALDVLVRRMDEVFEDLVLAGLPQVDAARHPEASALFSSPNGLPDGNVFGIVLHGPGAATEDLSQGDGTADATPHQVWILNCSIGGLRTSVTEVVALRSVATGAVVKGPAGDVIRFHELVEPDDGATLRYKGDALSEVQFALAAWLDTLSSISDPGVRESLWGTLSIDAPLLGWWRGERSLAELLTEGVYEWAFGRDPMSHVNKGAIGLRIDGGSQLCVQDLEVSGIVNEGAPTQGPSRYTGADARGLTLSGTHRIELRNLRFRGIESMHGTAQELVRLNTTS